MTEKETCTEPKKHPAHMCQLSQEGRIEEMDKHSAKPNFVCNRCRAKADTEDYLCNPRPL